MTEHDPPDDGDEDDRDSLEELVNSIDQRRQTDEDDAERSGSSSPDDDPLSELGDSSSSDDASRAESGESSPPGDDSLSELGDSSPDDDSLSELADSVDDFIWAGESDATEDATDGFSAEVRDALADADNVLVLGPLRGETCDSTCVRLLTTPRAETVLFVTATRSIERQLEVTEQYTTEMPNRISVVRVGGDERARERSTISTASGPTEFTVQGVDDPSDLTRLGIAINRSLSEWDTMGRTAVCVHSLTELLQYVDQQRLFRFVHILQAKLESSSTVAHFHLNPDSHSPRTVSVFETLFDYVVDVDDDGSVSVTETE